MPLIPFIIGLLIYIVVTVKKKQRLEAQKQAAHEAAQRNVRAAEDPNVASAERMRRQEELKRRLQENQARRQAEAARDPKTTERRPLEKRSLESTLQKEKPVVRHTDEECGGGSMHDGYHEGVTQFAGRAEASVAGRLGHRLADEDERIEREHAAVENAKKAMARIAKLPPLAQGMVYSEILGKPRSEIA